MSTPGRPVSKHVGDVSWPVEDWVLEVDVIGGETIVTGELEESPGEEVLMAVGREDSEVDFEEEDMEFAVVVGVDVNSCL